MGKKKRHILVIRLSALGDIAISVPLIKEYALKNPQIEFSVLSQPFTAPLFAGVGNLHFIPFNLPKDKKGVFDVVRFVRKELLPLGFTEVADIHDVIRTKIMRLVMQLGGVKVKVIDKGRKEKAALVREKNKVLVPLKSSMRRYEEVLVALGLQDLGFAFGQAEASRCSSAMVSEGEKSVGLQNKRVIGIAPFAQHKGKCWPLEYIEEAVKELSKDPLNRIILFGGGKQEVELLEGIAGKYPNVESAAGRYKMKEEQVLMRSLDVMVSMDSANMHLASLVNTPVISIWGATHPYAGFYGWGQKMENAMQVELACRPCSIYGNKPCMRGDYACLCEIKPQQLIAKILEVTAKK